MGNKIKVELSHGGGRTAKFNGEPGACFRCGQMGHWARCVAILFSLGLPLNFFFLLTGNVPVTMGCERLMCDNPGCYSLLTILLILGHTNDVHHMNLP